MTLSVVEYWCILVYSFLKDSFQNVFYNFIREYITYNNLNYKIVKYIPYYNKRADDKITKCMTVHKYRATFTVLKFIKSRTREIQNM